jgi:hypothetical protein
MLRTSLAALLLIAPIATAQCLNEPFPARSGVREELPQMPLAKPYERMPDPAESGRVRESKKVAPKDVVLRWNEAVLFAIRTEKTPAPVAARNLAMVHAAIFDSVNAIDRKYESFYVGGSAPRGASPEVAAAVAAHHILSSLYPKLVPSFEIALDASLASIPDGPAKANGISAGHTVAEYYLRWRGRDGQTRVAYKPSTEPGHWQPTDERSALLPGWSGVGCFALRNTSQFRAVGPPAVTSPEFAKAFAEVKELGGANSTKRTNEQTMIAHFWADGDGTATPPGHWNRIARSIAAERGLSTIDNARLFAMLNVALADAAIACWECKYKFDLLRPVTAIHTAAKLGNAGLQADADWTPLLPTPPFPSYTSGHSTFSGAAAAVLTAFFGKDDVPFRSISDTMPGVRRSYAKFSDAANEAGMSRIYGGIHYGFDNADGLKLGKDIGEHVAKNFFQAKQEAKPMKEPDPKSK